jgi:ZIP family zinc transporter
MTQIILFSAIAGIGGMGLGGLISAILLKKPSDKMICWLLSFAAGVMVSIVCFGLVPEVYELKDIKFFDIKISTIVVIIIGLIIGIVTIMCLNRLIDRITEAKGDALKIHHTHEELYHESRIINNPTRMLRSGMLMLFAIALHNVPEGMAIGAGSSLNFQLGALLAFMIAIHNIPEGMAIAAPLLAGGINKWKVIFFTALAGSTTLIGGIIGILIGGISDFAIAISLSAAGGAMLYIVFGEIMPQSLIMTKDRKASIVTLFGIIVGLIVTQF